jgi:pimeloyl-ACP methyl ester carboxylesterase
MPSDSDWTLHYKEAGSGGPVVLLHGFPLTLEMWRHQVEHLSRTHRVIAPDLAGFGGSSVREERASMEAYARDVADLLDSLHINQPVALAGFSMGGYVALAFLRLFPERVAALALVDSKASADSPEAKAGRADAAARVLEEGSSFMAEAMIGKLLSPLGLEAHPELASELVAEMSAQPRRSVADALCAMAVRPDSTDLLGEMSVPTVVVGGALDLIATPGEMATMAEAIAGAEYVEIPGAGHLAPMEAPDAVSEALGRWLARVPA